MYEYDELRVRILSGGDRYRVIASSLRGEVSGELQLPFSDDKLEVYVLRLGKTRQGVRTLDSPQMGTAKELGGALFEALFQGDVRDAYQSALTEADDAGKGLRITLLLSQAPELMDVPWEYLCDDGSFLAVSERTPIVRYLDLKKPHRPLALEPPLRILGMVSSPRDLDELDVEEEKARLEAALAELVAIGRVEIRWLEKPTLRAMLRSLERETFHVLHYIGHGMFDKGAQDGVLILEDENGRAKQVTGDYLGQLLKDVRSLRLAVLNACEGARASRSDPFAGVATSLVRYEIPSVIAMQFEITDTAAITFAEGLYAALARGAPVDAALASARKAIWADHNDVEWGTPVLFMRVADGHIFDVKPSSTRPEVEDHPKSAIDVAFLADRSEVTAGDEVLWRLAISNAGLQALSEITAVDSSGIPRVESHALPPGRQTVTTWRTRPDKDVETSITVTATDLDGNRSSEQISAHVTVQSLVTPATLAPVSQPLETRESGAAGGQQHVPSSRSKAVQEAPAAAREPIHSPAFGRELMRVTRPTQWLCDSRQPVAFSPVGDRIVTADCDGRARVWDVSSGQELTSFRHGSSCRAVALSPDGDRIATAGDKEARVWDLASGRELISVEPGGHPFGVAFSPEGNRIATTGNDKKARVWDLSSGRELISVELGAYGSAVAFSNDGDRIATGTSYSDHLAQVWELSSGQELMRFKHGGVVTGVAFSPDGGRIATASDKTARVWELSTRLKIVRVHHDKNVKGVAFSPDGDRIATASDDKTARVWELSTGLELARVHHDKKVKGVAFSPDGDRIATASDDGTARVWEVPRPAPPRS